MIGERLCELRKDCYMSQQQLADMLSLSKYTISSYENNKTEPNDSVKAELAKIFDTSVDYLLGLTDERRSFSCADNIIVLPGSLCAEARLAIRLFADYITERYKLNH